ncbi:MAG: hypothetical protein K9K86_09840 [Pseudomonadales bacterium]|nr:hypothetical protein [Pseudomonadales bacterium]
MYLSAIKSGIRLEWYISTASDEFYSIEYLPPAKGVIVPYPGMGFMGRKLSSEECFALRGDVLAELAGYGIKFCCDDKILHISMRGKNLCSEIENPMATDFQIERMHLCPMCQYTFWRVYG